MSVLVVGSIALDSIETPFGKVCDALGGSATYFSLAASLFGEVRLVGVVGSDFPRDYARALVARGIDTRGLVVRNGRTFRWDGAYCGAMNEARTLDVQLNVFGDFDPRIPAEYADTPYVFLANGSPRVQRAVREQLPLASLVVCDTMNFWIESAREDLKTLLGEVHGLVLNDQEARMLTGMEILVDAGRSILDMGPSFVVIKKGEHGALLVGPDGVVALPAYPTREVKDPTGAGDSFAGGMMGCIAADGSVTFAALKRAMAYGTAVASITVEGFATARIMSADRSEVDARFEVYRRMLEF